MEISTKLNSIKALIIDVDGVLTDGKLWMSSQGEWRRTFHIHDGMGLKTLLRNGFRVGLITGSQGKDIQARAEHLGLDEVLQGVEEKWPAFEKLLDQWGLSAQEIAYIGDDLPDLPVMEKVGWAVTVPNAHPEIKERFYCTERSGGHGAVREICDQLMTARKKESENA